LACISARCHSRRMCTCAGRMSRRSNTASAGSSPIPPQRLALPGLTAASVGRHPTFRQIQTSGTIRTSAGREEQLPPRLEGARLEQVPRLHHGRGALQLADEGLPPRGRRALCRHRAQCQTALRGLQETIGDVNLHRHTITTKAEASNGLGFLFVKIQLLLFYHREK